MKTNAAVCLICSAIVGDSRAKGSQREKIVWI